MAGSGYVYQYQPVNIEQLNKRKIIQMALGMKEAMVYSKILFCVLLIFTPLIHSAAIPIPKKSKFDKDNAKKDIDDINVVGKRENIREFGRHAVDKPKKFDIEEEKGEIENDVLEAPKLDAIPVRKDNLDIEEKVKDNKDSDKEDQNDLKPHEQQLGPQQPKKKLVPLKLDELQPPDHLDAVKMEQDGHLNKDYKKEILFGNHEEFENGDEDDMEGKLKDIFKKVDIDKDNHISLQELEDWIVQKVQEHFDEAGAENERIFLHLDSDQDGLVAWEEFHLHFLLAKGHSETKAEKHVHDYETIPLDPDDKEKLIRFKFRWAEADDDPQDNKLTLEEFRAFRHPEQSKQMLSRMVQDILDNLDSNNDGKVTEDEFIALPPGEVDPAFKESDRIWQEERRKEFRNVIDLNKDRIVTQDELKVYVDPQNENHATMEAENLIGLADADQDGKLSLEEVLENMELFLGSKVVDTGRSFHDEF